jgi:aarF domain-containing kinase
MWTQDFVRVLQGAGKVAEQLARTQGPDVATKSGQLSKHATELARLVPYFLNGEGSSPPVPPAAAPEPVTKAPVLSEQVPATIETPKGAELKHKVAQLKPKPLESKEMKPEPVHHEKKVETQPAEEQEPPRKVWEEKHVPSSPLSRILGFGGLAARLAVGTAAEIVRSGGKNGTYNALVSDANAEKLAETLCTMRGAALKLGQMLSIQDEAMIPSKLAVALDRVREKYEDLAIAGDV